MTMEHICQAISQDLGNRYLPRSYLGSGRFATVWLAEDRVVGKPVAVKCFHSRGDSHQFYGEMRALFLLRHPHIVQLINLWDTVRGRRYLILEYCAGGSLRMAMQRAALSQASPCIMEYVAELGLQLANGLAEAHRLGLIHRDLKPENILFSTKLTSFNGRAEIKLADFGLARVLSPVTSLADTALRPLSGSPAYMAPEQFLGVATPASDRYALGVVLYELLHGRPPFQGDAGSLGQQHLYSEPPLADHLPTTWRELLTGLLRKDPTQRSTLPEVTELLHHNIQQGLPRWRRYVN
ncbi:MAG: serine/threonine-protein kinase [Gemmataceae bacterium]